MGTCVLSLSHISLLWILVTPLAIVPDKDWSCNGWEHVLFFRFHWIPSSCLCLAHTRLVKFDRISPCIPARLRISNDSGIRTSVAHFKNLRWAEVSLLQSWSKKSPVSLQCSPKLHLPTLLSMLLSSALLSSVILPCLLHRRIPQREIIFW